MLPFVLLSLAVLVVSVLLLVAFSVVIVSSVLSAVMSDEEVFSFLVMSLVVADSVLFVADYAVTFFFLLSFPQAVTNKEKIKIVVIIEIRFFIFVPPLI